MNEEITQTETSDKRQETSDKFKLGKKWFFVGIVIALLHGLSGLIFGIALALEKKYRKEGSIIAILGLVVIIASVIFAIYISKVKFK